MKGLMLKDLYILKRNLLTCLTVTVGVILLSILFVLSSRYGNIADILVKLKAEPQGEEQFFASFRVGILLLLILPTGCLFMINNGFIEDTKAGFYKVQTSLPVTAAQIVGARYLSFLILAGICLTGAFAAEFFVSLATDAFPFGKTCLQIFNIFCVLLIYNLAEMPLYYYFGSKRIEILLCLPLVIFYAFFSIYIMTNAAAAEQIIKTGMKLARQISTRQTAFYILCLIFTLASYFFSCLIYKKKEGNP